MRLALALLVCAAISGARAEVPYVNPVAGDPAKPEPELADPHVLRWCGEYWMYTSGSPIVAHHSVDLVHWTRVGPVLSPSDKPEAWNQADVWAPEVYYRNGKFLMYYTASRKSEDWRVGEYARRVGLAVADSPAGPFVDIGRPVTPVWAIDGTVFTDPDGGAQYMFWSWLTEPRTPGAGIVAAAMPAFDRVSPKLSLVTRGSLPWEDKDADPQNGNLRYTNEGPVVVKRHGRYHLMYSGGSWDLPTYAIGVASSDQVLRGGLEGAGWTKYAAPILRATPLVDGPGHNALVKAPNGFDDVCVYHARRVPFLDPWNRLPFVDRLHWVGDRMYMDQPSLGRLAPPDRPLFADRFDRDGAPGEGWRTTGGSWRVAGGELAQDAAEPARAVPAAPALGSYVFEVSVRAGTVTTAAGASKVTTAAGGSRGAVSRPVAAGVSAWAVDDADHVEAMLDPARAALVVSGARGGNPLAERRLPLPKDFRWDAYHQLTVTRDGTRLAVALDGVNQAALEVDARPAQVALVARGAGVRFDGVALTNAYDETFDAADHGWETQGGAWLQEDGALHQVAGGGAPALALKGDAGTSYEFTATLRVRDADGTSAHAGIVAGAAGGAAVLAGWDRTIWPLQRFRVFRQDGGALKELTAAAMPRGFDDGPHAIRVVRQGDAFTFWLDGRETAAVRAPLGAARPGIYTAGARAAFEDASFKRLGVEQNLLLSGGFETEQWDGVKPAAGNPWALEGSARPCDGAGAHSGWRRLVVLAGNGAARQHVPGLAPGKYVLYGFGLATAGARGRLTVSGHGGAAAAAELSAPVWTEAHVDFEVAAGNADVTIGVEGTVADGASLTCDDLYLARRE